MEASHFEPHPNPLVGITLHFEDGTALKQVFSPPVSQLEAMRALGHLVAELGAELNIELPDEMGL